MTSTDFIQKLVKITWKNTCEEKKFYLKHHKDTSYIPFPWEIVINQYISNYYVYDELKPFLKPNIDYYTCFNHSNLKNIIQLFTMLGIKTVYCPSEINKQEIVNNIKIIYYQRETLIDKCNYVMSDIWFPKTSHKYHLLSDGQILEYFFFEYVKKNKIKLNKKYINVGWTNLYHTNYDINALQSDLDNLPRHYEYFTLSQEKILESLPPNTLIFGRSNGNFPLPLIYNNDIMFNNIIVKKWSDKDIFCSFIGKYTHKIRLLIKNYVEDKSEYFFTDYKDEDTYTNFLVETVNNSKFCLVPRGKNKSSFRFFETIKLGSVPVYIWDNDIWLPFQDVIDYKRLAVIIHISNLNNLDNILKSINEDQYNNMISYSNQTKELFSSFTKTCEYIVNKVNTTNNIKTIKLNTHMPNCVEKFFQHTLQYTTNYLEFGGGGTTIMASEHIKGKGHLITSIKSLHNKLSNNINSTNFKLNYVDIESTDDFGYPSSKCPKDKLTNYTNITNLVDLNSIDTILVKGRFRVACLLNIFNDIKHSTIILFDDYTNRNHYHIVEKYYDIVNQIDRMVVLKKKKNVNIPQETTQYIFDAR